MYKAGKYVSRGMIERWWLGMLGQDMKTIKEILSSNYIRRYLGIFVSNFNSLLFFKHLFMSEN